MVGHVAPASGGWALDPLVVVPLLGVAAVYARWALADDERVPGGVRRRPWRVAAFVAGWVALVAALASPLEAAADDRFAWHMVQHLLLTTAAAPLLAGSDVGRALRSLVPRSGRVAVTSAARRAGPLARPSAALPLAGVVATVTFVGWHAPALYDLAVRNDVVHVAEHVTMLGTAYLLWRAVVLAGRRGAELAAAATVAVVGLPEIALGALLTVSPRPWYSAYALAPGAALADQQLGGLLMWIPTGVVHLAVALALVFRCLGGTAQVSGSQATPLAPSATRSGASSGRWT